MKIITANGEGTFENEGPIHWHSPGDDVGAVLEAPVIGLRATASIYGRMGADEAWRKFKGPVMLDKWRGSVPAVPFYRLVVESFQADPSRPDGEIMLTLNGRLRA